MPDFITVEQRDAITILTFNRPERRNALSQGLREETIEALGAFNADDSQRALVLTGAGDKAFSAGQDLSEMADVTPEGAVTWQEDLGAYLAALRNLDKPIVAAINGVATGAGFYTALLCDLRVAHPGIRMGQPELNVGFPSIVGTRLMYMTLGHSVSVDMTLTGRLLDAEEALQRELVTELVAEDQVMPRAMELAQQLAEKPPMAMKLTKQSLREFTQDIFDGAIETGKRLQPIAFESGEPQRTVAAFLNRKN